VDRIGAELAITDYKTGVAPSARLVAKGLAFQPVAYAEALARRHPDTPITASFLTLKKPDALRRTQPLDLSEAAREPLMAQAVAAAEDLAAGRFSTTVHGPTDAGCSWCPHRRICRVDHAKNQEFPCS
jgi:RecB family exonuclease